MRPHNKVFDTPRLGGLYIFRNRLSASRIGLFCRGYTKYIYQRRCNQNSFVVFIDAFR